MEIRTKNSYGCICVDQCEVGRFKYKKNCYVNCPDDTIPYEGRCYSNEERCDIHCKTCSENPNLTISSNCTSCYDDEFLDNGKCVDSCSNGYFIENSNIKICKCELKKCNKCNNESLSYNLCISCNTEDKYYLIFNDSNNIGNFIECYNYSNITGYYLDTSDNIYKKCYSSCSTCKEEGNFTHHNCLICEKNYIFELNFFNTKNCYQKCEFYFYHNIDTEKYYCTYNDSCPREYIKLIPEKKQCVKDCEMDSLYHYEYNNICYKEEQKIINTNIINSSLLISQKDSYNNNTFEEVDDKEKEEKILDNIRQELIGNFDTEELDKGENIIIKLNYTTITITTTKNQKNDQSNNITTINFEKCEEKIKSEYIIPEYKSLYILKIDAKQNGIKIPKIGYEVYYPLYNTTLIKLNLTVCFNTKIEFSIPINITYNVDKANSSSDYYKSICYTDTSNYGTDIPLEDRKREFINNNLTTCEEDCDFIDYNSSIGKAVCSCFVNTNDSFKIGDLVIDTRKLYKRFTNIKSITNINVLKCYNKVFNKDTIKANCGNIIIVCIALLFLASLITFWFKEFSEIKKVIKVITYFKLNPQVVTKFLKKSHKNENNNKDNKKKNKSNNKQLNKKEGNIIIEQPNLNIQYLDVNNKKKKKRKKELKSNPIKKNKKANKIKTNNSFLKNNNKRKNTNINSLNKLQAIRNTKNIFNQIIYPDNLSEEQLYDLFLKIDKNTDTKLNDLSYEIALKIDKRTYCQYYTSLVRMKHLFFYSFWPSFDYNSRMVKIYILFQIFFDFGG